MKLGTTTACYLAMTGLMGMSTAQATELDINISNKALNAQVNVMPEIPPAGKGEFDVGVGYLYHEDDNHVLNVDFHARGQTVLANMPTTVRIGARAMTVKEDKTDASGAGIAIGGGIYTNIPQVPGLAFRGNAHIAPSITAFGDLDQLFRIELQTTYRVIQNADVYVGYRNVRAKIDGYGSETLDNSLHVGFTLLF